MPRQKKTPSIPNYPEFPKKWGDKLPPGWTDSVDSMDKSEMETNIIKCEKEIASTEKDQDQDEKLKILKDDYTLYRSAYVDVINTQKAKIKFLLYVGEERGYA